MMMSTLSCSTSLRAMRIVVSGLVSVGATTVSTFLPAMVLFTCLRASSTLRTPSWPPVAKAPSSATRMPILIVPLWARAAPGKPRATTATALSKVLRIVVPPSDAEERIRQPRRTFPMRAYVTRPSGAPSRKLPLKAEAAHIQASHFRGRCHVRRVPEQDRPLALGRMTSSDGARTGLSILNYPPTMNFLGSEISSFFRRSLKKKENSSATRDGKRSLRLMRFRQRTSICKLSRRRREGYDDVSVVAAVT